MRLILSLIVILIAVFIGIIGVALVAVPAQLWTVIAGNPDLGPVDFATLKKTSRPNQYLLCPEGICKTETPDAISKTYPFSPVELKEKLKGFGATAQNMVLVHEDNTTLRFVARSPQLKFPDTISIEVFPAENGSTLAIYARAQLGYRDFNANKTYAQAFLSAIEPQ